MKGLCSVCDTYQQVIEKEEIPVDDDGCELTDNEEFLYIINFHLNKGIPCDGENMTPRFLNKGE